MVELSKVIFLSYVDTCYVERRSYLLLGLYLKYLESFTE